MKKFLAFFLIAAVMVCMSVPAFAVTLDSVTSQDINVTGTYQLGSVGTTYSVDITWENMAFTYTANAKWDENRHSNVEAGGGTWTGQGTVTVVNNSNAAVNVAMAFVGKTTAEDAVNIGANITGALKNGGNAYTTTEVAASGGSVAANLTITGGELKSAANAATIGTVTVTLSAV